MIARISSRFSTFGILALASLSIALLTGVLLALPYDLRKALVSLQMLELGDVLGRSMRSMHGWSGNLLVIFTLLHGAEHLWRYTERRMKVGVWLRVLLSFAFLLFLMISGFMLKADKEGLMARQVVDGLLRLLPLVGEELSVSLLGQGDDLQLIYLHHVGTASIGLWIIAAEHGRRFWPTSRSTVVCLLLLLPLAFLFPPILHNGVDPFVRGPWYFVGLQEILHQLHDPRWIWLPLVLMLAGFAILPRVRVAWAKRFKWALLVFSAFYLAASLFASYFRGSDFSVQLPWAQSQLTSKGPKTSITPLSFVDLKANMMPLANEKPEGCLHCHKAVKGLSASHSPKALGCRSCHLGDPNTLNAKKAHSGIVRVPGNLDTAALSCGQADCHPTLVSRVKDSLMANIRGIVAVDRFVFGESPTPDGNASIAELGDSPADKHLESLCATCHLSRIKQAPAPIDELSRGGGCTACHISYDKTQPRYTGESYASFSHPKLTIAISDDHCFGCHSRSGRISLSYSGWAESAVTKEIRSTDKVRKLKDGRSVSRQIADIHQQRGMACIDCHTARETMGDGQSRLHQESAIEIACADCHTKNDPLVVDWKSLDGETQNIIKLRKGSTAETHVLNSKTKLPYSNVVFSKAKGLQVKGKLDGRKYAPKAPAESCTDISGHQRLSCSSCHSAWVPYCISCHSQYDETELRTDWKTGGKKPGRFIEYAGEPGTEQPVLGVMKDDLARKDIIQPFAPGMIMTLNKRVVEGPASSTTEGLIGKTTLFRRLFAPVAPHTTAVKSRSCASCHLNSLALGLGKGRLTLEKKQDKLVWKFRPTMENLPQDGLPADAWTGFDSIRQPPVSTRKNARPFTPLEMRSILRVGACLGCHDPAVKPDLYRDFSRSVKRTTEACRVPSASTR